MPKQKTYDKLKPWFDKAISNGIDCPEIARRARIGYGTVIRYYSMYLRKVTEQRKAEDISSFDEQIIIEPICPTCGRKKSAVHDVSICRDIIHFV